MAPKPSNHGRDHNPFSADAINTDWHDVGATGEPDFKNSWGNAGGGLAPLRFRMIPGGSLEIQGSVTGGTAAAAAFTLPLRYRPDTEARAAALDDAGAVVVIRVLANGNVIVGS